MTTRNVTSTGSIPAGVLQVGTLTSVGDDTKLQRTTATVWVSGGGVTILQLSVYEGAVYQNITGTNTTTPPSEDVVNWQIYNAPQNPYLYIYIPNDGAGNQRISRVTGVAGNLNDAADTYTELWYVADAMPTTGAVAFQLVEATLKNFSIDNNGGANGEFNGETFKEDEILNAQDQLRLWGQQYYPAFTYDASGTNFYIVEN